MFFTDFWNLGAYGSEITRGLFFSWYLRSCLEEVRQEDQTYSHLISSWKLLEEFEKPVKNQKQTEKEKRRNPQTKKSSFIWVSPKHMFLNCIALLIDDISSDVLWLTELHKLCLTFVRALSGAYLVHLYLFAFSSLFTFPNCLTSNSFHLGLCPLWPFRMRRLTN